MVEETIKRNTIPTANDLFIKQTPNKWNAT
jgi:hypothetical protein